MKKILLLTASQLLLLLLASQAFCQSYKRWPAPGDDDLCFHKGNVLYSITEGITYADYSAKPLSSGDFCHHHLQALHDPEFLEYAFSPRWSAGIELSTDLLNIAPSKYYDYATITRDVDAQLWDLSLFLSHHYIVTQSLDLSNFIGMGMSAVTINGKDGDTHYHYNADGYILRAGTRATYYVRKGYGLTGMLTAFTNTNSSLTFNGNTFGQHYITHVSGFAWEFGVVRRF